MNTNAVRMWNAVIWAAVMIGCAVLLKAEAEFIGVLIVLACGAAGTDAVITRRSRSGGDMA